MTNFSPLLRKLQSDIDRLAKSLGWSPDVVMLQRDVEDLEYDYQTDYRGPQDDAALIRIGVAIHREIRNVQAGRVETGADAVIRKRRRSETLPRSDYTVDETSDTIVFWEDISSTLRAIGIPMLSEGPRPSVDRSKYFEQLVQAGVLGEKSSLFNPDIASTPTVRQLYAPDAKLLPFGDDGDDPIKDLTRNYYLFTFRQKATFVVGRHQSIQALRDAADHGNTTVPPMSLDTVDCLLVNKKNQHVLENLLGEPFKYVTSYEINDDYTPRIITTLYPHLKDPAEAAGKWTFFHSVIVPPDWYEFNSAVSDWISDRRSHGVLCQDYAFVVLTCQSNDPSKEATLANYRASWAQTASRNIFTSPSFETSLDRAIAENKPMFTFLSIRRSRRKHSNAIIIHPVLKKVFRMEPHGTQVSVYDEERLDKELRRALQSIEKLKSFEYIPPARYQDRAGPQRKERRQHQFRTVVAEFGGVTRKVEVNGFCKAWVMYYLHMSSINQHVSPDVVYQRLFGKASITGLAISVRAFMGWIVRLSKNARQGRYIFLRDANKRQYILTNN